MIKFFRKIRQSMINQNRTKKYLLYAIGEIILVVIGILIALQVNNWNEERKKKTQIDQLLLDIEKDLISNYKTTNYTLDFYRKQDSLVRLIAAKKLTEEDYNANYNLRYLVSNWEYLIPKEKNINQFVESEKIVNAEYKPIIEAIKDIQYNKFALDDTWSNLDENIENNGKTLFLFNWFVKNDAISNAKAIDYFLNDESYETLALAYWAKVQNYYDKVTRYRAQTMAALATIKRVKYGYSNKAIIELFQQYNMQPFVNYGCDVESAELMNLKKRRASELYANFTNETLYLNITNNFSQPVATIEITPNTFRTIPSSGYFGLDGDNNNLVKVIDERGHCINAYGAVENGYLIIE
ncbi:MAG: hypothetical protein HKN99_01050 [Winogradskyella sp.]|nr:hypothetical protein [Winogradskyella sp.]MBT8375691.1 hypothetical protein [Bacteroidia bacterium]NNC44453.1 hypothetical protein [Winogradskyella sp.]NNF86013.1 hypothetical protein [Winogradskyella sp.]NNK39634.1 hypothetical protein [Winogradskyella sp.]